MTCRVPLTGEGDKIFIETDEINFPLDINYVRLSETPMLPQLGNE